MFGQRHYSWNYSQSLRTDYSRAAFRGVLSSSAGRPSPLRGAVRTTKNRAASRIWTSVALNSK